MTPAAASGAAYARSGRRRRAADLPRQLKEETMTTPAPAVTDHDDFERQLLELRKRESDSSSSCASARRHTPARATRSPRPGAGCP